MVKLEKKNDRVDWQFPRGVLSNTYSNCGWEKEEAIGIALGVRKKEQKRESYSEAKSEMGGIPRGEIICRGGGGGRKGGEDVSIGGGGRERTARRKGRENRFGSVKMRADEGL